MSDGKDGKPLVKINWEQFKSWQSWDEYPELSANPPMTLDMTFYYEDKEYYLEEIRDGFAILTSDWDEVIYSENFLTLLTMPLFEEKSFKKLIEEFWFVN